MEHLLHANEIVRKALLHGRERAASELGMPLQAIQEAERSLKNAVHELYSGGERNHERIASAVGLTPRSLERLLCTSKELSDVHLSMPRMAWKGPVGLTDAEYAEMQQLLENGTPIKSVTAQYHISRQWVHELIRKRKWKANPREATMNERRMLREQAQSRTASIETLAATLTLAGYALAENPAEAQAYLYSSCHMSFPQAIPLPVLVSFYQNFNSLKGRGERASLAELARPFGMSPEHAGRLLDFAGEKPCNGARERHALTPEQQELVGRALQIETSMPYAALGKIIRIPSDPLRKRAARAGIRKTAVFHFPDVPVYRRDRLTVAKALDLYEALDAGFSEEDAREYAGIATETTYQAALKSRLFIEGEVGRVRELLRKSA